MYLAGLGSKKFYGEERRGEAKREETHGHTHQTTRETQREGGNLWPRASSVCLATPCRPPPAAASAAKAAKAAMDSLLIRALCSASTGALQHQRRQALSSTTSRRSGMYTHVSIAAANPEEASERGGIAGGGYLVLLDGRPVNTPVNRRPLVLPTASLAMGIAGEWASQERTRLAPWSMPLTSLACTAADQSDEDREQVIATVMDRFFEKGDVALCRCDEREDAEVVRRVGKSVRAMDAWRLAAFNSLAFASKSVVIATCAVRSPETVGIEEVMKAARVEEEIQIERWGLVEGGHDMDIGDLRVRVSSAMVYLRMLDAPWEALVPGAVRPEARSRSG